MEKNIIKLEDNSGDKKYFSQLPHYILNHSTAVDQALYWQMKRYAGESGKCFATQETLMKKLGVGKQAYKKSLKYLLDKGWIKFVGMTHGKTRPIKTYSITDIWKLNILHYEKIPSETALSFQEEIPSKTAEDTVQNSSKIKPKTTIEEEPFLRITNKEETISKEIRRASYGNAEINKIINFLEEKLGGSLDGPQKQNRQFAYLLINKIRKDYPEKNTVEAVYQIIEMGMEDQFHAKNITSFKYLYYNTQKIIQSAKNSIKNRRVVII